MAQKRGRKVGTKITYTPNQKQRYQSEYARYMKAIALVPSVYKDSTGTYIVPSSSADRGYWTVRTGGNGDGAVYVLSSEVDGSDQVFYFGETEILRLASTEPGYSPDYGNPPSGGYSCGGGGSSDGFGGYQWPGYPPTAVWNVEVDGLFVPSNTFLPNQLSGGSSEPISVVVAFGGWRLQTPSGFLPGGWSDIPPNGIILAIRVYSPDGTRFNPYVYPGPVDPDTGACQPGGGSGDPSKPPGVLRWDAQIIADPDPIAIIRYRYKPSDPWVEFFYPVEPSNPIDWAKPEGVNSYDGTTYTVDLLDLDPAGGDITVDVDGEDKIFEQEPYPVTADPEDAAGISGFQCNCQDFSRKEDPLPFSRNPSELAAGDWTGSNAGALGDCKHIMAVKLALGQPVGPFNDPPLPPEPKPTKPRKRSGFGGFKGF